MTVDFQKVELPVVDIAALRSGCASGLAEAAAAIGAAARDVGFFRVAGHGIPTPLMGAIFRAAHDFFALSADEKDAVSIERSAHYRGYARLAAEQLDPARPGDAKESFNIGRELADDDPDLRAGAPFAGANQWPVLPGFRAALLAYYDAQLAVCGLLHRAIAADFGLDPGYFEPLFTRPLAALRLLHYPPHPGAFDGVLYGAAPHTDYGNLTLLAQDDTGGLEVQSRDGGWIAVEPVAGRFVCNIGDALMRLTNDHYVSTPHRVVNRSGRERYSIAFFGDPNADASIACLARCCSADRPARYEPMRYADYLRARFAATYANARRPA